jgi:hypothetical protein
MSSFNWKKLVWFYIQQAWKQSLLEMNRDVIVFICPAIFVCNLQSPTQSFSLFSLSREYWKSICLCVASNVRLGIIQFHEKFKWFEYNFLLHTNTDVMGLICPAIFVCKFQSPNQSFSLFLPFLYLSMRELKHSALALRMIKFMFNSTFHYSKTLSTLDQ